MHDPYKSTHYRSSNEFALVNAPALTLPSDAAAAANSRPVELLIHPR
jgi:hypothetical protein